MQPWSVSKGIRVARANVQLATQICGGADKEGLRQVLHLLGAATREMRRAETAARSGLVVGQEELSRETALLKREIACMMRAVDGCASLCRGLSVRLGGTAPAYTPRGCVGAPSPSGRACKLLG